MEEFSTNIENATKRDIKMDIFTITPHKFDPLFEKKRQIIESASKHFGINVHYGPNPPYDEIDRKKTVDLYKHIDFFIADLSYERPSCYFEVGFVQALDKPVVLIAMDSTDIHQILDRDNVRFYKDIYGYETLINSILRARAISNT